MKNEIRKIHAIDTEVNFGVYENTLESICYKHLKNRETNRTTHTCALRNRRAAISANVTPPINTTKTRER